jgi:hypothetical protein
VKLLRKKKWKNAISKFFLAISSKALALPELFYTKGKKKVGLDSKDATHNVKRRKTSFVKTGKNFSLF